MVLPGASMTWFFRDDADVLDLGMADGVENGLGLFLH